MKCNQYRPGFELVSPCPFPTTITITPRAPPRVNCILLKIYSSLSFVLKKIHISFFFNSGMCVFIGDKVLIKQSLTYGNLYEDVNVYRFFLHTIINLVEMMHRFDKFVKLSYYCHQIIQSAKFRRAYINVWLGLYTIVERNGLFCKKSCESENGITLRSCEWGRRSVTQSRKERKT